MEVKMDKKGLQDLDISRVYSEIEFLFFFQSSA